MVEKEFTFSGKYKDRLTGEDVPYDIKITALIVEDPVMAAKGRYFPRKFQQRSDFGLDKIGLRIRAKYINRLRAANLQSHFLQIDWKGEWARIRVHREVLDQDGSIRSSVLTILWDLMKRGLFYFPTRKIWSGKPPVTWGPYPFQDARGALQFILRELSVEHLEVFFDHQADVLEAARQLKGLKIVGAGLYSPDFIGMRRKFYDKKSVLKIYNKVECKLAVGEKVFEYEADRPYRVEFTLTKGKQETMSWLGLDCSSAQVVELLRQDLAQAIERVCPDLRVLADVQGLHPELKRMLGVKPKQRLSFSRGERVRRMEGFSPVEDEIDRLL